jgi:hypothetical protein
VLRGQVWTDSFFYGLGILPLQSTRFGIGTRIANATMQQSMLSVTPSPDAQQAKD